VKTHNEILCAVEVIPSKSGDLPKTAVSGRHVCVVRGDITRPRERQVATGTVQRKHQASLTIRVTMRELLAER
jgi:hypothetical protein